MGLTANDGRRRKRYYAFKTISERTPVPDFRGWLHRWDLVAVTPTLFALLVCAGGLLASGSRVLYLQMVFCLFGAAAAIALPALGGATITPAVLFLPFLLARALGERGPGECLRQVSFPGAGFWLLLLVVWGVLSAYFLPRMFAGQVQVLAIHRDAMDSSPTLRPLYPVSGNLTQSGYALGALCAFVAMRALLLRKGRLDDFRDAVLLLAGLNCLAGLVNLAEFHLGLPSVLEYVRTGGYAIVENYELAGLMRVSGTFSEASAFSGFTLPLLAFSATLWLNKVRAAYSGTLALILLLLLLFSTSTTAYVGLTTYLFCVTVVLVWRGLVHGKVPRMDPLIYGGTLGLMAISSVILYDPGVVTRVAEFFEVTVVNKLQSSSGIERSSWSEQAWTNFLDTYGAGVGLGSARASSFPLVLLSNVGAFGTLLFLVFLSRVFLRLGPNRALPTAAVPRAARQAVLAALISASVSAAVFDLGVAFYALAAAATVTPPRPEPLLEEAHGYA